MLQKTNVMDKKGEFKVLRCMIYACDIVVDSLKQLTPSFLDLESKDLKLVGVIKALWCTQKRIAISQFSVQHIFMCLSKYLEKILC
jgi:hypothetical protein